MAKKNYILILILLISFSLFSYESLNPFTKEYQIKNNVFSDLSKYSKEHGDNFYYLINDFDYTNSLIYFINACVIWAGKNDYSICSIEIRDDGKLYVEFISKDLEKQIGKNEAYNYFKVYEDLVISGDTNELSDSE